MTVAYRTLDDIDKNIKTSSYTLTLPDAGTAVLMNVGSANNLTVPKFATVPFPVGTQVLVIQMGAGQTTVVAGDSVTVNKNSALTLKLTGQYSIATLIKTGTNVWVLGGDLDVSSLKSFRSPTPARSTSCRGRIGWSLFRFNAL
jgi:hypothetical protein